MIGPAVDSPLDGWPMGTKKPAKELAPATVTSLTAHTAGLTLIAFPPLELAGGQEPSPLL